MKILDSKEVRNASWMIGEQVFQMLVSLLVGLLAARYLGPSNFGALSYTASFVSFFFCITSLGMEGVIIKKIIANPKCEGEYLGGSMLLRLFASIISVLAIGIIIVVVNPGDSLKLTLALLQSTQLLFKSVYILDSWFQRHLKSRYVSIGKIIACLVVSFYKIFLLILATDVVWFAISNTLSDVTIAIVLFYFYKKEKAPSLKADLKYGMNVLSESYHFIISGLMVAIYGQMDRVMIGKMMTDSDVGFYTTAMTISGMWIFVPTAIINSFRPRIMELKHLGDELGYQRKLQQLYSGIIWLCLLVSLLISLTSPYVVGILFGDAYLDAVGPLKITIWSETFAMIGTARGIWILSEGKNQYVKYYLGVGAVINLILNYLMIPALGINGAAWATLFTQIVTSLVAPVLFKETRIHSWIVFRSFIFSWVKK